MALLPIAVFFLDKDTFTENLYLLLPLLIPLALVVWIYFDTFYKIEKHQLIYRSGFLRGRINISDIKEIVVNKTRWSGIKAAMVTKGLIIKYNNYDDIYIAPENNDELIADLLKINSEIKITKYQ